MQWWEVVAIIGSVIGTILSATTLATLIRQSYSKRLKAQIQEVIKESQNELMLELKEKLDKLDKKESLLYDAYMDLARDRLHE